MSAPLYIDLSAPFCFFASARLLLPFRFFLDSFLTLQMFFSVSFRFSHFRLSFFCSSSFQSFSDFFHSSAAALSGLSRFPFYIFTLLLQPFPVFFRFPFTFSLFCCSSFQHFPDFLLHFRSSAAALSGLLQISFLHFHSSAAALLGLLQISSLLFHFSAAALPGLLQISLYKIISSPCNRSLQPFTLNPSILV